MMNLKNTFNNIIYRKLTLIFASIFLLITNINAYSFEYRYYSKRYCICFSPKGNCQEFIESYIYHAKKQILIAMYSFTNFEILKSLVEAKSRGVKVKVILYKTKQNYKAYQYLKKYSIDVKLVKHSGLMHNKFIIIDDNIVGTGSYNYTYSANDRNDENIIFVKSRNVNKKYTEYFWCLWDN